ncbi:MULTISPECIES: TIM-barrel domain-containing protein [unclassified Arthrobacter]|uniref:TIM-barrel domain-containing protein n=1 Tax=unclassified Arthrobacter TaxID=235627 RepID=UPI001C6129AD|nr:MULTISPECIES: TIM-barrel domain-containing protein [unclassified Arthrobacter]
MTDTPDHLEIRTEHLFLSYDKKPFSPSGLVVSLRQRAQGGHFTTWRFGAELPATTDASGNLGGTARTLDNIDGACTLEPGILARYGFAVVEDSTSVEIGVDGWIAPRPQGGQDLYFFGHGTDYQAALTDYFRLTGPVPLVPRRVLGNWWSRYWKYSADEYLELMDAFAAAKVPFSVAVIDMDWHLVDIDPRLGTGWTGYTWNSELFPEPQDFLSQLQRQGKLVTLNLHPADGVRAHEEAYPAMAEDLGIDPATEVAIPFDITNRTFVDSYLKRLHHPLEEQGVDFWWLDWQQGGLTRIAGLDPLWMLNHIHYHDSGRDGRRPLTFSRYSGLGSHRYPVGFSGDTVTTWESLDFQPYFTATAANVGYTWWSHDVGGHFGGIKDNELTTRWVQFGAFSPINRLHSSMDPFNSKDPLRFPAEVREIMIRFLQVRHLLVPYLYTAAWRAHSDGVALLRPMYHDYPESAGAYTAPNQYLLGDNLIVAPITTPVDRVSLLASVTVWLPEGEWVDLFTGQRYRGGRHLVMYRSLEQIPVLARAGAVIAMLDDVMQDIGDNPDTLVLRVTPGSSQSSIVEDDGSKQPAPEHRVETTFTVQSDFTALTVQLRATGESRGIEERTIILDLAGVLAVESVEINGKPADVETSTVSGHLAQALRIQVGRHRLRDGLTIRLTGVSAPPTNLAERAFGLLDRAQMEYQLKHRALDGVTQTQGIALAQFLDTVALPGSLHGALLEVAAEQ